MHEWYLKIQLEDIKDYQLTLEYIGKLDFDEVCIRGIVKEEYSVIILG